MADAALARRLSPALTVLHGPFAGMRYASAASAGSALLPKIVGSYERELQPALSTLLRSAYTDIVDIGCAEGYYAVGLATRLHEARVHAFDTDPAARKMCRAMADANGIGERLTVAGLCDPAALLALPLGEKALVISDCEGYEAQLFTPRVARHLGRHDLLVEVHDRADPTLGPRLREVFGPTHDALVIDSIDDTRKLRSYRYAEIEPFDLQTRRHLLSEGRGMVMEWLCLTPKVGTQAATPVTDELMAAP